MRSILRFGMVMPALLATLALSGCPFGPRLETSANVLRFNFDNVTQEYDTVETFTISNSGRGTLNFGVTVDQPWISVTPAAGANLSGDASVTITVTVNRDFSTLKAADFSTAEILVASNGGDKIITATVAPDYFTEVFSPGQADIDGLALTFTPNGGPSFYEGTQSAITEFPTDPADGRAFPLDFDAFGDPVKAGLFGGKTVNFYGEEYDELYISSEGWVSFGEPGNSPVTPDDHFENPQISGLPVDATQSGATVSYQQDADKLTITYENAATKGVPGFGNDFQIELFFDGVTQLSFLNVDPALSGIVGLSGGFGQNGQRPGDFVPSDFSGLNTGTLKSSL